MRKPVKLAIGIYLGTILIISCSYLILILIGSVQGNDMKGAVTDVSHTEQVKSSSVLLNEIKGFIVIVLIMKLKGFELEVYIKHVLNNTLLFH